MKQYIDYLKNAGIVSIAQFDEDFEPIGSNIRMQLLEKGIIASEIHFLAKQVMLSSEYNPKSIFYKGRK